MDIMSAFLKGQASRFNRVKVFDWDKAAQRIKETKCKSASAGLSGDWEYTGGSIFENGKPVNEEDTYVYLSSTWATPELDLDGYIEDCWIYQDESPGWGSKTYWPESALKILQAVLTEEQQAILNHFNDCIKNSKV